MTRRLILAATAVALIGGGALPALAGGSSAEDTERICFALSSGPDKEPVAPLCVWVPTR